jgi:hypothetical protein
VAPVATPAITLTRVDPLPAGTPPAISVIADGGGLGIAASVSATPQTITLTMNGTGCTATACDESIIVRVPLTVTPIAALPGALEDFTSPSPDRPTDPIPGLAHGATLSDELLITLGTPASPGSRLSADAAAAANDGVVSGGLANLGVYEVRWNAPQDLKARRAGLAAQPGVTAVSESDTGLVGDNDIPSDWSDGPQPDGPQATWPFTQVRAQQAWTMAPERPSPWFRGSDVTVGIVETGVPLDGHEDLGDVNVVGGFGGNTTSPHATHVAGLACAKQNGIGLVGIAWGCPLVAASAGFAGSWFEALADKSVLDAASAVARQTGVKVVNISMGYNYEATSPDDRCAPDAEQMKLIDRARGTRTAEAPMGDRVAMFQQLFEGDGREIVWTLSAGNNCAAGVPSPWGLNADLPNVITVAATNSDNQLASFSDFGPGVEVAAPGGVSVGDASNGMDGTVGIWSTYTTHTTPCAPLLLHCGTYSSQFTNPPEVFPPGTFPRVGTSQAAPIVAGIAALVRSAHPDYGADKAAACITDAAGQVVGRAASRGTEPDLPQFRFLPRVAYSPSTLPIVNAEAAVACIDPPPEPARFTQITAGADHTCGLRSDGSATCWGRDASGQAEPPAGAFTQIDAGSNHTCGLRDDATAACWGSNYNAVTMPPAGAFLRLTSGRGHACGLRGDGAAVCWGFNQYGQTNAPAGVFVQLEAGQLHTCGLRGDGTVVCWGDPGLGDTMPPQGAFTQLAPGARCGLRVDGSAVCWGYSDAGQTTPPAGAFTQLAGAGPVCGLRSDGTAVCWGLNHAGQATPPAGAFTHLDVGGSHSCGLRGDETAVCWGDNSYGQTTPPTGA